MKPFDRTKKVIVLFVFSIVFSLFMSGCTDNQIRNVERELFEVQSKVASVASAVGRQTYGADETINLLKALQAGNTASAPFNPYALPIGIGLTGLITMLEALRRKEKGGRKYAEHELKNGKNGNGNTGH